MRLRRCFSQTRSRLLVTLSQFFSPGCGCLLGVVCFIWDLGEDSSDVGARYVGTSCHNLLFLSFFRLRLELGAGEVHYFVVDGDCSRRSLDLSVRVQSILKTEQVCLELGPQSRRGFLHCRELLSRLACTTQRRDITTHHHKQLRVVEALATRHKVLKVALSEGSLYFATFRAGLGWAPSVKLRVQ